MVFTHLHCTALLSSLQPMLFCLCESYCMDSSTAAAQSSSMPVLLSPLAWEEGERKPFWNEWSNIIQGLILVIGDCILWFYGLSLCFFRESWTMYKKEWFLDLFVGKFVILHQSSLKTYLSSGLFSDPSGSHFEILKSNFEEFDLSQFGDFLTLLALNRSVDTTLTLQPHGGMIQAWFCLVLPIYSGTFRSLF